MIDISIFKKLNDYDYTNSHQEASQGAIFGFNVFFFLKKNSEKTKILII